jgi:hypothetical protein
MIAVMSPHKPRISAKGGAAQLYELSIYSYEKDDVLQNVVRIVKSFGFKARAQAVGSLDMPHSGTKLYTTQIQLKLSQDDASSAVEKAYGWFTAMEAKRGWDVRFAPCAAPRTVLSNWLTRQRPLTDRKGATPARVLPLL